MSGGMSRGLAMLATIGLAAAALPQPAMLAAPRPAPPPPAPDAVALAAARRLIAASDMQRQLQAIVPQIVDAAMMQARGTFKANAMPAELDARLQAAMRESMTAMMTFPPAVQERMALVYANNFSAADLDHLADLMADPAMVRFRERAPAVMKEVLPVLMALLAPQQAQLWKRTNAIIADWLRDHPGDGGRLARPAAS